MLYRSFTKIRFEIYGPNYVLMLPCLFQLYKPFFAQMKNKWRRIRTKLPLFDLSASPQVKNVLVLSAWTTFCRYVSRMRFVYFSKNSYPGKNAKFSVPANRPTGKVAASSCGLWAPRVPPPFFHPSRRSTNGWLTLEQRSTAALVKWYRSAVRLCVRAFMCCNFLWTRGWETDLSWAE